MNRAVTEEAKYLPPKIEITAELLPQDPCRNEFTGLLVRRAEKWVPATALAGAEPGLGSGRKEEFTLSPSGTGSSSVRACGRDPLVEACLSFLEQTALSGEGLRRQCGVVHNSGSRRVQIGCCGIQAGISLE